MTELVVISGKGGTGKTSIAASFAVLAGRSVIADCDVDAADLHLILNPVMQEHHEFRSGHEAIIQQKACNGCGICMERCRYNAVVVNGSIRDVPSYEIDPIACEGCGVCVWSCPNRAIAFPERLCGEWMVSETRCGPMVHANLNVASENSGKLVATVRENARRVAGELGHSLIIVDGPPGIGCPVIASITGASVVLIVTEPTVSGIHDMERVVALTQHFKIPAYICINKWDVNPELSEGIAHTALQSGVNVVGRIAYDAGVSLAQILQKSVVEMDTPSGNDIRKVWERLQETIAERDLESSRQR